MIKQKQTQQQPEIDLTGPQGNVFFLIGTGKRWCKQLGLNPTEFTTEMTSGDYEHAVQTFDNYFGEYCILYR